MLCFLGLKTLHAETKFNPILSNGLYCFQKSEAFDLIEAYDTVPGLEKKIIYLTNQVKLFEDAFIAEQQLSANLQRNTRKEKARYFCIGTATGAGIVITGILIIIIKSSL